MDKQGEIGRLQIERAQLVSTLAAVDSEIDRLATEIAVLKVAILMALARANRE